MLTASFKGTYKSKLRIEIFGIVLLAGAWITKPIDVSAAIPAEGSTIHLPDGFTLDLNEGNGQVSGDLKWEGVVLASKSLNVGVPGFPIALQPIKGVLLTGTLSLSGTADTVPA